MVSPSSTSSSEASRPARKSAEQEREARTAGSAALPWGAVLALIVVLLLDRTVFLRASTWERFDIPESVYTLFQLGLVRDRLELLALENESLEERGDGKHRSTTPVFLLGSSRLEHGFLVESLPKYDISRARLVKLAHPQFYPFEMRAAADVVATHLPGIVVLALSELETHARIELLPGSSFGNASAVADLARAAGPAFAFEHRALLARIAVMGFFNTYHYRDVLDTAGFGVGRKFPHGAHLGMDGEPAATPPTMAGQPSKIPEAELVAIVSKLDARFAGPGSVSDRPQFELVRSVSRGRHAEINLKLVRRTIEVLIQAGGRIILVEPPIYPEARALYDPIARQEFQWFARDMARDERVSYVGLEQGPVFEDEDFSDLTHLERAGAFKFTRVIIDAIGRELERDSGNSADRG